MGDRSIEQPISLPELDARHDDLLDQLEELDQRIQTVLKEHLPQKAAPCPVPSSEDNLVAPLAASLGDSLVTSDGPSAPTC